LQFKATRRKEQIMAETSGPADPTQPHQEHEDLGWTVNIPGHPKRKDSPEYIKSREAMNQMARQVSDLMYGHAPYQDHHGGGLWLKDEQGWFMVRNLAGVEWSAQFCADPAKIDLLRQNAKRIYAAFPQAVQELGIQDLLDTSITDADGVARWTDSICNASVPLPQGAHTGVLPTAGGVHHYPSPVTEIAFFKYGDFQLWVTDQQGNPAAVAPVNFRGSGDGRVHVLWAADGSELHRQTAKAEAQNKPLILGSDHPISQQAFAQQNA
jgi:hypothetical protein